MYSVTYYSTAGNHRFTIRLIMSHTTALYVHDGGNGFRYNTRLLEYSAFIKRILIKNVCGCEMGPVTRGEGFIGVHFEAGTRTNSSKLCISRCAVFPCWDNLDIETG